jgi:hypothetical protein
LHDVVLCAQCPLEFKHFRDNRLVLLAQALQMVAETTLVSCEGFDLRLEVVDLRCRGINGLLLWLLGGRGLSLRG